MNHTLTSELKNRLESAIEKHLQIKVVLYFNYEWAKTENRANIRLHLLNELRAHGDPVGRVNNVLSLSSPPISEMFFVSISHCEILGGYGFSKSKIGLDIERNGRVTNKVIQRLSRENSNLQIPTNVSPTHVWTAQEAAYKALSTRLSLNLLSQISVSNWKSLSPYHIFDVYNNETTNIGHGMTFEFDNVVLSLAKCEV